jgi:hypothetical protein
VGYPGGVVVVMKVLLVSLLGRLSRRGLDESLLLLLLLLLLLVLLLLLLLLELHSHS